MLGDTCDSSAMAGLCAGASLLVHEATNAKTADETASFDDVESKARDHGHSTPQMAGRFAREVGAEMLLLTHFSARYSGDESAKSVARMQEIADMAARARAGEPDVESAGGAGGDAGGVGEEGGAPRFARADGVVCAADFMTITLGAKGGVEVVPRGAVAAA